METKLSDLKPLLQGTTKEVQLHRVLKLYIWKYDTESTVHLSLTLVLIESIFEDINSVLRFACILSILLGDEEVSTDKTVVWLSNTCLYAHSDSVFFHSPSGVTPWHFPSLLLFSQISDFALKLVVLRVVCVQGMEELPRSFLQDSV